MENSSLEGKMIACCGLVCSDCPAYLATQANDEENIAATAEQWSKQFGADIKSESVWCDGCTAPGRKCGHCGECEIRSCATAAGLDNCGHCAKMTECEKIQGFFKMVPPAKDTLEIVATSLKTK